MHKIAWKEWSELCGLTDEQKQKILDELPDPTKEPSSLLLGSFTDAMHERVGLKEMQKIAWQKLASRYSAFAK